LCNEKGIKVIYASSSTAREWWRNPYAMSKKVCEQMAPENSCGMRFSTVWGKGARPTMLIPRIAEKNLLYATSHTRDFIHVSDIVSAINVIIQRGCVGVVEIGSGKGVAVDQLVAMNGIDVPIKEGSDVEQDENVLQSSSLRTLGWRPLVDVMEVDIKEYL
jgi:nucleoside-diphosphate-sugar epimerase